MKIIIADDFYTNRLLVSEILKDLGHELIEAENGKEALEALENNNDIDLILMDIEMPVMGGLEAIRYIREKLIYPKNRVPIIALTAHNPAMFPEVSNHTGFDGLLVKPYSIHKIAEILETFKKKQVND
jgi:two-component system, sensor histidine kinase and response regulator